MMEIAPVLGIDPGHDGAAALLDEAGAPVWAARWRPLKRGTGEGQTPYRVYRLDLQPGRDAEVVSTEHRTLAGVGRELGRWVEDGTVHLAAEGLFVASMARQDAAIELGKTVGWLTASIREYALSYDEPAARKWRPSVLGCSPAASSNEAERLALWRWRSKWAGALAEDAHVAEAECIAWYRRAVLRHQAAQLALLEPGRKRRASR
jgi:hypothetical protein